jgi:hypothetical protein
MLLHANETPPYEINSLKNKRSRRSLPLPHLCPEKPSCSGDVDPVITQDDVPTSMTQDQTQKRTRGTVTLTMCVLDSRLSTCLSGLLSLHSPADDSGGTTLTQNYIMHMESIPGSSSPYGEIPRSAQASDLPACTPPLCCYSTSDLCFCMARCNRARLLSPHGRRFV